MWLFLVLRPSQNDDEHVGFLGALFWILAVTLVAGVLLIRVVASFFYQLAVILIEEVRRK